VLGTERSSTVNLDLEMEWMPLIVALVSLVLGGCSAVLWFLYLSVRQDARDALEAARVAQTAAEAAKAEAERKVGELRVHVAETYVTQEGLTKAISSLDQAINRLIQTVSQQGEATRAALSEIHRRIDGKADK
jgi:Cdc6-like AAA superfamily ATPase